MTHARSLSWCIGLALGLLGSCHRGPETLCDANGCWCPVEDDCTLPCPAPPCHVDCRDGSRCDGECANGECTCRAQATCDFGCDAPPCHVICEGDNPHCNGVCANGSCTCGPDSSCAFVCDAPPCHASCPSGSACTLECPSGYDGNCDFTDCAAGEPAICGDGTIAACGVACPAD